VEDSPTNHVGTLVVIAFEGAAVPRAEPPRQPLQTIGIRPKPCTISAGFAHNRRFYALSTSLSRTVTKCGRRKREEPRAIACPNATDPAAQRPRLYDDGSRRQNSSNNLGDCASTPLRRPANCALIGDPPDPQLTARSSSAKAIGAGSRSVTALQHFQDGRTRARRKSLRPSGSRNGGEKSAVPAGFGSVSWLRRR
jgi:hypothetical protein